MNGDRVAAVISATCFQGSLIMVARAVGGIERIDDVQGFVALTVWRENDDTIRMSLRNAASETVAYVHGGASLIALVRELGIVIS